jgi:hypothetical protein
MAFNANSSEIPVVKEGKLYTGLANMKVVAINPNKAQLEQMGYKPQNEPSYTSTGEDNQQKVRMDFYLEGEAPDGNSIRTKLAFFLENVHRTNKEGNKGEWINNLGRTAWGTEEAPPAGFKWFDHETARPCKIGENEIHLFLINWLNIQPGDEAKLDNFEALFLGNYSELLKLLAANPQNRVRVLLGVKDGKYQAVYNRYFDRATNKKVNYWVSHIEKQTEAGYPPKEDFQGDLTLKEWVEVSTVSDQEDLSDNGPSQVNDDPF